MNIYFIPGLGADKRIFRNIIVPEGCKGYYFDWIAPLKNETLRNYALRLAEKIDTSRPFIVVGLSFGGMLGAEIVNSYPIGKLAILSSVASSWQLPFYYRIAGKINLHRLVPVSLLKSASLMKRLFTAETAEQKAYLKMAIRDVDASFIRWGLDAIVNWHGSAASKSYIHIHGSRDAVLPVRFCRPTHIIKGGGHLMILTRNTEINKILNQFITQHRQDI
ncbi:MAG TPA: alpha/beta hydrolase [Flavitalea sp.]|nr:alpha/beta hydrolase [Flavitalea sp.]